MRQDYITVRKARDADIDVLLVLSEQLGYPTNREDFQKRFSALSQEDDQVILVAEIRDHGVVGWVHVLRRVLLISGPVAEIGGLVVDEKKRGKGIGRILDGGSKQYCP